MIKSEVEWHYIEEQEPDNYEPCIITYIDIFEQRAYDVVTWIDDKGWVSVCGGNDHEANNVSGVLWCLWPEI